MPTGYIQKLKEIGNAERWLIPNVFVLCNLLIVNPGSSFLCQNEWGILYWTGNYYLVPKTQGVLISQRGVLRWKIEQN